MRREFLLVKQGSLLSSDHVPHDKISPWFTKGQAPTVCKSSALGKAWRRLRTFRRVGSDILEHNMEILMLNALSESQKSEVMLHLETFPTVTYMLISIPALADLQNDRI